MSIIKRSTSGIMQNVMNQPMYQQMVLNAQNVGQDKRAVGSRNSVLGGLVRSESKRLLNSDIVGSNLAMRKDKLGFAKQMAAKQNALAQAKMDDERKRSKLTNTLGLLSTGATGFGNYNKWKKDRAATKRADDLYNMQVDYYKPHKREADAFNALPRKQRIK